MSMRIALYEALYIQPRPFQWIHFTEHGVVPGAMSPGHYGWSST